MQHRHVYHKKLEEKGEVELAQKKNESSVNSGRSGELERAESGSNKVRGEES